MISSTTGEHPIPEELLIKYPKWLPEDICPKYSTIETIVNVLFETVYTENHIIKYTTAIRNLGCDDSLEK